MNRRISKLSLVAVFALPLVIQANARITTKDIVVEFPPDLPAAAQQRSEAMFLYHRGDEAPVLYLEQDSGRTLAILDVADPAKTQSVGQVSIDAPAPFDFVQYLGHSAVLIHYRNHSGFALLNLADYKKPVLEAEPKYLHPASAQTNGANAMLLVSSAGTTTQAPDPQYEVVSVSGPANAAPLATIRGVIQRVDRPETGTVYLLTDSGLNVVRCLGTEQEHKIEMNKWHNG